MYDYVNASIVEYFDEMQILKSEKAERVRVAKKMQARMHEWLHEVLLDILAGVFMAKQTEYANELIDLYLAMVSDADKSYLFDTDVNARASRFSTYILQSNMNLVQDTGDYNFEQNLMLGVKMQEKELPSYVNMELDGNDIYSGEPMYHRSVRIAEVEANWIENYIRHKKLVDSGQINHTWLTQRDEKVRGSHALADGQTKPINEPFDVGGYKMLFPADDSMGAPAELTMNCRCVEI